MRYRTRSDANQKEIDKALRDAGASVLVLGNVGKGCPDRLVGFRGVNYLMETKNPASSKKYSIAARANLMRTPDQTKFHNEWRGGRVITVFTPGEALVAIGVDPRLLPLDDQLRALLGAGEKIRAIKLCRESAHIGLREAKDYVEALGA